MRTKNELVAFFFVSLCAFPASVFAGGFEAGENTAIANGRGGTGVVSRDDAAAILFNPSMLVEANGVNLTLDVNLLNENLSFQRDPLLTRNGDTTFDEAKNQNGYFPIPFVAVSTDFFTDWIALGLGVFGPHSYGKVCMTEYVDGECVTDLTNGARHMLISSDLIEIFSMGALSMAFHAGEGDLLIGFGGGFVLQQVDLDLVVDQIVPPLGAPYTENPNFQGAFHIRDLSGVQPVFNFGLTYILNEFRIGFSARPGVSWKSTGKFEVDLPESVVDLVSFSSDELELEFDQAGSYRFGIGWFGGQHPYYNRHRFDIEMNVVYEDWSRLEQFLATPKADLLFAGAPFQLSPVVQQKGYQDTVSLRLGGSYAVSNFLTVEAGGFLETAAQRNAVTNADFVSWERYSASAGLTYDITDFLALTLSFSHIASPSRTVKDGKVFQSLPLSQCTGPDYTASQCPKPGLPSGSPQNNGTWSSSFQTIGAGLRVNLQ